MASDNNAPMSMLERERAMRLERASRRRMLIICVVCLVLIGLIGVYFAAGLNGSRAANYPITYKDKIDAAAARYELDPALVCAVIYTESHFDPDAVSSAGARGLMQIMPGTGEWISGKLNIREYNDDMLFDTDINIEMGCWLLRYLSDRYDMSLKKTLAAYNAGQGTVDGWLERPECSSDGISLDYIPSRETRNYVKKVKAAHDIYIELYYADAAQQPMEP